MNEFPSPPPVHRPFPDEYEPLLSARAHTQLASHCSARSPSENALYRTSLSEDDSIDGATFFKDSKGWLILSLFGAALVGVLFLALFRSFARQTVWGIIYLKVAALGTVGAYALCTDGGAIVGGILLALTAFTAFVFYLWRNEIELVARLLAVAVGSSSRPWVYPCFRWYSALPGVGSGKPSTAVCQLLSSAAAASLSPLLLSSSLLSLLIMFPSPMRRPKACRTTPTSSPPSSFSSFACCAFWCHWVRI